MKARAGRYAISLLIGASGAGHAAVLETDVDAGTEVQRPLWELGLGVGGLRLPDYPGSDVSRNYLLPVPYVVYRGTWLKSDRDGTRAVLLDAERVSLDISAAARPPTHSADNSARSGMANLPGTLELGPNLNVLLARSAPQHWRLELRLPVRAAVTLQRSPAYAGATFAPHLNLDLDLGGAGGRWNVGLQSGPVWANRQYNALFYGVDAADATGLRPAYQARAGYAGWQTLAATSYRFGANWVGAFVRYDQLQGAVFGDSPLVRRRGGLTLGFGIARVFASSSTLVASHD